MANPTFLPHAFAEAALPANITVPVPDAPTGSNAASWQQGFPPITMTPKASGGQPPEGADLNGILNAMSAHTVFLQQGGVYAWNATFAAATGYSKGAMVMLNDGYTIVVSTANANSGDPNSGGNWLPLNGIGNGDWNIALSLGGAVDDYTTSLRGQAFVPGAFQGVPVQPPPILAFGTATGFSNVNTGASTLTIQAVGAATMGPYNLLRNDGQPLQAGDIQAGDHAYLAVFLPSAAAYRLINDVPSQHPINALGPVSHTTNNTTAGFTMQGLGAVVSNPLQFTPQSARGICMVTMQVLAFPSTNAAHIGVQCLHGTGTPPVAGAAVSGSNIGFEAQADLTTSTGFEPVFTFSQLVQLTPGVANWFDLAAYTTDSPNNQSLQSLFSIHELM